MTGDTGIIRCPARALQVRDYSGLLFNNAITPSDIDGAFEIGDKLFAFLEYKYGSAKMPRGQELFLERLCDAVAASSRCSIVIEATHYHAASEVIDCANAKVTRYRWNGKWYNCESRNKTVRQVLDGAYAHAFSGKENISEPPDEPEYEFEMF